MNNPTWYCHKENGNPKISPVKPEDFAKKELNYTTNAPTIEWADQAFKTYIRFMERG